MPKKLSNLVFLNQIGSISIFPILVIIAAVGVIAFLLITSTGPFQSSIFQKIYPKPPSDAATNQIYWGAFIEGPDTYGINPMTGKSWTTVPWDCNVGATICPTWDMFQSHTGKNTSLANLGFGQCWGTACTTNFNNRLTPMNAMVSRHNIPLLGLGSFGHSNNQIISGIDDEWITTFAQQAKSWGHPFMLRFDWEMNGSWFDWGGAAGNAKGNTPQSFIDMWKHVHDIFTKNGATNVTWVWCPNEENASSISNGGSVSNAANYYPGDDYVDWTCFDVYNWGTIKGGSASWRTWEQMAGTPARPLIYQHLLQIAPSKPILVGETASSETGAPAGTNKAAWFSDMLAKLPVEYPQIKAVSFFLWKINDGGAVADWPIETSTAAQSAFAKGISSPYFASNNFGNPPLDSKEKISPIGGFSVSLPTPVPVSATTASFTPVADTYVASDCPTCVTAGTADFLYTDGSSSHSRMSFLRFDLSSALGKTITSAILRIHTTSDSWAGSTGTQNVYFVNDDTWKEANMDWITTVSQNAILSTPIGSYTGATQVNSSYSIPINTSLLYTTSGLSHVGSLFSIMLSSASTDNLTINSRESGSTAPELILTYAPSPIQSFTPTPSPTPTSILPDVVVTNTSWSPTNLIVGTPVTFTATVKNQGNGPTPAGTVIGVAFNIDGVKVTWSGNMTQPLGVGASANLTANNGPTGSSLWIAVAGTHTLSAYVDDVNRFAESNENNNIFTKSLTVINPTPTPTPIPWNVQTSAIVSPVNPTAGRTAVISTRVTSNQTTNKLVDLEVFDASGTRIFQQFWDNQSLVANQTKTYTSSWTPNAAGVYVVEVGIFNNGWNGINFLNQTAARGTVNPQPTPTPMPFNVQTSATVSPVNPTVGKAAAISTRITSNQTTSKLVDLEVFDASGTRIFQQFWDNQNLTANQTRNYTSTWVPKNKGSYIVKIGIFNPGWNGINFLNQTAARGSVL